MSTFRPCRPPAHCRTQPPGELSLCPYAKAGGIHQGLFDRHSAVLNLTIHEIEDVLCAALQELPLLEAYSSVRREIIHYLPRYDG